MKIKILISITFGLLLGIIISKLKNASIKLYKAPSSEYVKSKIFNDDNGNKFKLKPKIFICPAVESMKK